MQSIRRFVLVDAEGKELHREAGGGSFDTGVEALTRARALETKGRRTAVVMQHFAMIECTVWWVPGPGYDCEGQNWPIAGPLLPADGGVG